MAFNRNNDIIVVGSINMDLVVSTLRHPEIGETILATDFHTFPGGKGANQSVAVARLGGHVSLIGRLGEDYFGSELHKTIRSNGVDVTYLLRTGGVSTGVALITVSENGDNTIVVAAGANGHVGAEDVENAEGAFEKSSVLLVQLELPDPAIEAAVALARKHHLKVVLNPSPARELDTRLLAEVDYLIPNQIELSLLTGIDNTDAAIGMLHSLGVKNLVVTLGEDGALVATGKQQYYLPAFQVEPVDATAAGDAFVGAFAVALNEGQDLRSAVTWGNAAGAIAVTKPGAQPSLPTRQELEQFLHQRMKSPL
jgi:ribokinase